MNKNTTVRHHLLECILWPQENGGKLKWNDFQKEFYDRTEDNHKGLV